MTINLHLPNRPETLRPTITVIGIGGAGGNAVNNMITSNLEGVSFVVANTDAQALDNALAERRIQLGATITRGLGAGASPEVGRAAAEEALDELSASIQGSNMVFITAGMGGGTGTGAAPVVARMARDQGILTVGVVTKPFQFEGTYRMRLAENGLTELQNYVDTLIVIPNQNLFRIANEHTTFADAFKMADEVLHSGVRGVTDLMVMPGLINLDFADIRAVMREMGKAMMGTGEAEGPRRAVEAAEAAISNPLLDDVSMKGARGVLINITGGPDMTLFEVDEAANRIREEVDADANIIFGSTFNDSMEGKMRVSVVSTGIEAQAQVSSTPRSIPVATPSSEQKRPFTYTPPVRTEAPKTPKPAIELPKEVMRSAQMEAPRPVVQPQPQPDPRLQERLHERVQEKAAERAPERPILPSFMAPLSEQKAPERNEAPRPQAPQQPQMQPQQQQQQPQMQPAQEQGGFKFTAPTSPAPQAPAPQQTHQAQPQQHQPQPQRHSPLTADEGSLVYDRPSEARVVEEDERSFVESGLRTTMGVSSYTGAPNGGTSAPATHYGAATATAEAVHSRAQAVIQSEFQSDPHGGLPPISPRESYRDYSREEEQQRMGTEAVGKTLSLFQKVVGIGRSISARNDEMMAEVASARTAVVNRATTRPMETAAAAAPAATKSPEEEYLDIPAFLRRQAN